MVRKVLFKRVTAVAVAVAVVLSAFLLGRIKKETPKTMAGNDYTATISDAADSYGSYITKWAEKKTAQNEVSVDCGAVTVNEGESREIDVFVEQEGLYSIELTYSSLMTKPTQDYAVALQIDGQIPFKEVENASFYKTFKDETAQALKDDFGNELTPQRVEVDRVNTQFFRNFEGYYNKPYQFYFTSGNHNITLYMRGCGMILRSLTLKNEPELPSYTKKLKEWQAAGYKVADKTLKIEAEKAELKNDLILSATNDSTSSATYPQDAYHILLNTIGGENWAYPGQSITWKIPTVNQSGLYRVSMRVRQNYKRGIDVSRKILINGEVPYEELENYRFKFDNEWYVEELNSNGKILYVYLEAGAENTLTLEAVASYPEIMTQLKACVLRLNKFYREILMVVGTEPDTYQDYDLRHRIKGYDEELDNLINIVGSSIYIMEQNGFEKGGESAVVETISAQLQSFKKSPDTVPFRMSSFQSNITSMADWISNLQKQPLEIDSIYFAGENQTFENLKQSFLKQMLFGLNRYISSFTNDYSKLSSGERNAKTLEVWFNGSREQAQIIKNLTNNYFTAKTGINVNVNLSQQSLVSATLAGKGPDIAVNLPPNDIVNLAARNVLSDISKFGGYADVVKEFQKNSMVAFTYNDGVYAVPFAEAYLMLFVRDDVLSELGLLTPKTWDDFIDVTRVLHRNHLQAGIPNTEIMFQTLLYQNGGAYYKDGWAQTDLDSPEAQNAFSLWTKFYTDYSLPVTYDFFSRFRTGEMPIGIADYTMYGQFMVAAPEINGLWSIESIPATVRKDGTANNSVVGTSTGIVLFKKAEKKPGAFDYLNFITSKEIQNYYALQVESTMGVAARHATANIEAFKSIGWDITIRDVLLNQWQTLKMVEQTPVNYYVSRNITNAFRKTVYSKKDPSETLTHYVREIQAEIDRKRVMFGMDE